MSELQGEGGDTKDRFMRERADGAHAAARGEPLYTSMRIFPFTHINGDLFQVNPRSDTTCQPTRRPALQNFTTKLSFAVKYGSPWWKGWFIQVSITTKRCSA